jgi:hypothetical protein
MKTIALCALMLLCLIATPATAKRFDGFEGQPMWWGYEMQIRRTVRHRSHRHVRHSHRSTRKASRAGIYTARDHGGLVTVSTAAGIDIKVNPSFAPKIVAFIADLVATGYKPKQIHCAAHGGHVSGSRHYSGAACDFDQRGWGKTAPAMYKVAALARKHGLRDGGDFRDWGHIDDGARLTRVARVHRIARTRVARNVSPYYLPVRHAEALPQW